MFGIKEVELRRDFGVEQGTVVEVFNETGNISISSWDRDYIEIVAVKQSMLGFFMDQVNIEVDTENRFIVRTEYKTYWSRAVGVEYRITVPLGVPVAQVENLTGSIKVDNIEGDLVVQTSNGSINVENVSGGVEAQTSRGTIELAEVTGLVKAKTDNGKINIARVGGIHELRTKRGSITVEVSAIQDGLEISSQSGSITVFLSPELNAHIEANTTSGSISHKDLPISILEASNSRLLALLGEGNGKLRINTTSGSVNLKRLP